MEEIIKEYKGIALHNGRNSIGDPDGITHNYKDCYIELDYDGEHGQPYAFIYNKKENKILFSEAGGTHKNIFYDYSDSMEGEEVGLDILNSTHDLRYTGHYYSFGKINPKEEMRDWYEKNKEKLKVLCSGRIWYLENISWDTYRYDEDWAEDHEKELSQYPPLNKKVKAYIAFWNDIRGDKFKEYCDNIVKLFNAEKEKDAGDIIEYVAVGNNGEPIFMNINDNKPIHVKKRTSKHQKEIDYAFNYHNDNTPEGRKRKRELMQSYINSRNSHFQKEYYDKTNSKTAAEWHNNKTKRYNKMTGKMEWGEKIGDSLIQNITDYLYEHIK